MVKRYRQLRIVYATGSRGCAVRDIRRGPPGDMQIFSTNIVKCEFFSQLTVYCVQYGRIVVGNPEWENNLGENSRLSARY